ncbi:phosphorylase b kinase gamma catalytic chain, liver/testis isoform isoform X2 [Histomonas meleagridis]|uniref:phosphorylase b kinase gamma catalytic chain, liver/testis isoform isoform X2 n=1 Tax=Histomonas meleagridis TaxID=135588 RepID=UPI00355995B4|nr:phosphorylase b kinase gamma catalytic chain, liver/testis isoform isoform X2 [Histomonas meleagridis]KAH0805231.1 phosphorylase b kinase gamma catalytic chain, liver/testis isoform isoform X2 [Histomonas meleagridis]
MLINSEHSETEINILKDLHCQYVISVLDIFNYQSFKCIVMPLADVNAHKFLTTSALGTGGMSESMVRNIIYAALKALKYLHKNNICHRDIKTENILVSGVNSSYPIITLSDFGLAARVEPGKKLDEYVGTLRFAAPEIINHIPYDKSVDMWSLGVTMYTLLSGTSPFPITPESCLRRCIQKGAYFYPARIWKGISSSAKNLIDSMIKVDPEQRITAEDALKHPWIMNKSIPANDTIGPKPSFSMPALNIY